MFTCLWVIYDARALLYMFSLPLWVTDNTNNPLLFPASWRFILWRWSTATAIGWMITNNWVHVAVWNLQSIDSTGFSTNMVTNRALETEIFFSKVYIQIRWQPFPCHQKYLLMPIGRMIINNPLYAFSSWCIHSLAVRIFTDIVKGRAIERHDLVLRCLCAIDKHVCSSYFHHIHGIPFLVIPKSTIFGDNICTHLSSNPLSPSCGLCWSKNVCHFVYKSPWSVRSFFSLQCSHQHK